MDFHVLNSTTVLPISTSAATFQRTPIFTEVFYALIATLGIIGNGLVLFVFYKVRSLRVTTNILICNQSLIDFMASLFLLINFVPPEWNLGSLEETNPVSAGLICKLWHSDYTYWALATISTTNLIFITLERYFAVVFPRQYRSRVNSCLTNTVCVLAWVIGAVVKVYIPILHTIDDVGDCSSRSDFRQIIGYSSLITTIVIPLGVMIFTYTSILKALQPVKSPYVKDDNTSTQHAVTEVTHVNHMTNVEQTQEMSSSMISLTNVDNAPSSIPTVDESERDAKKGHNKKSRATERLRRNVLMTMFIVCVTYMICWTPNQILYFHHNVFERHDWSDPFHRISIVLASSNVCTNPFIYTFKYRSFQQGLKKVFCKK